MIAVDGGTKVGKWTLLILPLITVLREGIEAIVFVGGVSLGEPATSIPLAAIVGIICGAVIGYIIYAFASRTSKSPPLCPDYDTHTWITRNSIDHLYHRHDQPDPPHRCWVVQQVDWKLPGVPVC